MELYEIFLIGCGLSADAFAVSICKGLSFDKMSIKKSIIIGLYFGVFQALMPLLGYTIGEYFEYLIKSIDHWIVFVLLFIIGVNMIKESNKEEKENDSINIREMLMLAIATSIDAFSVGITFSLFEINIISSVILIGITTFILSFIGVLLGFKFGNKYKKISQRIGGILLIIIGIKVLLEHILVL